MSLPDFVHRTDTGATPLALRHQAQRVLEIHLLWEDLVLDTQHHAPGGPPLTVGDAVAWRWHCLGVDMGPLKPTLRHLAAAVLPMIGGVEQRPATNVFVPSDLLDGEDTAVLCRWQADEAVVHVPHGWHAAIGRDDSEWVGCDEREVAVPSGALLRLQRGAITLVCSRVRPAAALAGRPDLRPDTPFSATLGVVGMLGLVLGLTLWSQPPPPTPTVVEMPDRIMSLVYQAPEPPPPATPVEEMAAPKAKAKEDEGAVGARQGKKERAKASKGDERDRQTVANSGIFQAWGDPSLASLSSGGLSDGLEGSLGGLTGPRGVRLGHGGLGERGFGPGGGGDADLTSIQGRCLGGLERCGPAPDGILDGDGKRPGSGVPRVEDAILIGNMDRSEIDEVIKRHMPAIRYCYQQHLQRKPDLGGKIVVGFTIAGDGSVARAQAKRSTMDHAEVESCIVGRFLRMSFPKPRGGGMVIVSYPFLFAPG